jgi:hypothetical protein
MSSDCIASLICCNTELVAEIFKGSDFVRVISSLKKVTLCSSSLASFAGRSDLLNSS